MATSNHLSRRTAAKRIAVTCGATLLAQKQAQSDDSNPKSNDSKRATSSPKRSKTKKGICGKGTRCEVTNADWYYNWNWHQTPGKIDAEFVPMIKGKINSGDKSFAHLEEIKKSHGITHLLGFNEPDSESQGNTSVDRAIELWPKLMDTKLRLGSPAVTDNRRGKDWFNAFMTKAAAKRYRIDFITVHRYPNIKGPQSVKQFFASLEQVHKKYRLPIWITEFAGLNFGSKDRKMTAATNLWFMKQTLPILERLPYIERYSWFSSGPKEGSGLYDRNNADQLNLLGKFYRAT